MGEPALVDCAYVFEREVFDVYRSVDNQPEECCFIYLSRCFVFGGIDDGIEDRNLAF